MRWIRRSFVAGFFVMVPLIISVAALVWVFQLIDGVMALGQYQRLFMVALDMQSPNAREILVQIMGV